MIGVFFYYLPWLDNARFFVTLGPSNTITIVHFPGRCDMHMGTKLLIGGIVALIAGGLIIHDMIKLDRERQKAEKKEQDKSGNDPESHTPGN